MVAGALNGIDQYAVDHWMVDVGVNKGSSSLLSAFRPYPHWGTTSDDVFNVWTFPASVPVSGATLLVCCWVLERRGKRGSALVWIAAWVVGNAIEVVAKGTLDRPALHVMLDGVRTHIASFDSSYPSGHTLRAFLLAAMVGTVWHRAARPAWIWALSVSVALVVDGDHTPSDVLGGAFLALLVIGAIGARGQESRVSA